MNIATEANITGKPANLQGKPLNEPPIKRPVKMLRWSIIVGLGLVLIVGAFVGFEAFRSSMIKKFFAGNKPPPVAVNVAEAKSEVIPNLLLAVGDLAAVHQVNVTSDVNGRITEIMFTSGASVKAGTPLVQLFDGPEQGDLATFKAQATMAQLSLDRAKQLASRQFSPQATVDQAQSAFDQAQAGIAKTEAIISQKLVRAPFDGELGVRKVEVGQYLTAGTQIVSLTDLSMLYLNFTVTEKDSGSLKVDQIVRIKVDAFPGRTFEGKITTIEPQIATDTRNIRVQATIANPDKILKPGMFASTTVVLPDKPAVITVPETAVDYTLYGDSVFLIEEKKGGDDKCSLTATRTFVQTGNRIEGRAEILKGLKPGDRVVALGQLKLQSGSCVTISADPTPPIPAQPPRY
jgi:multidrug efflux system membrane fusion protein